MAVEAATVIVIVEVPAPVIDPGLKPTVTPVGWPVADSEMAESKPPVTVLVIVEPPELPCATETDEGDAERLNPGADELPARAVINRRPVRTAPAGRQVVTGGSGISIAAAGDVVEISVIVRAQSNRIQRGIDEPDGLIAVSDRLLIDQSQVASPHGRGKTGSTVVVGGARGLVGADVKGEIGVRGNVRTVAVSLGTAGAAAGGAGLPRRNGEVVG